MSSALLPEVLSEARSGSWLPQPGEGSPSLPSDISMGGRLLAALLPPRPALPPPPSLPLPRSSENKLGGPLPDSLGTCPGSMRPLRVVGAPAEPSLSCSSGSLLLRLLPPSLLLPSLLLPGARCASMPSPAFLAPRLFSLLPSLSEPDSRASGLMPELLLLLLLPPPKRRRRAAAAAADLVLQAPRMPSSPALLLSLQTRGGFVLQCWHRLYGQHSAQGGSSRQHRLPVRDQHVLCASAVHGGIARVARDKRGAAPTWRFQAAAVSAHLSGAQAPLRPALPRGLRQERHLLPSRLQPAPRPKAGAALACPPCLPGRCLPPGQAAGRKLRCAAGDPAAAAPRLAAAQNRRRCRCGAVSGCQARLRCPSQLCWAAPGPGWLACQAGSRCRSERRALPPVLEGRHHHPILLPLHLPP